MPASNIGTYHCQTAVLDLLQLVGLEVLGVLAEAQWVEGTTWVAALLTVLVVVTQALSNGEGDELNAQQGVDVEWNLNTEPGGVAAVQGPQGSLSPVAEAQDLNGQAASSACG